MIQDIAPHRYDNAYHPRPPKDGDRVFFYQDTHTLLSRSTACPSPGRRPRPSPRWRTCPSPTYSPLTTWPSTGAHVVPQAVLDAAMVGRSGDFRDMDPGWLAFACITANQLHGWYHDHQFCGRCGAPAQQDRVERAMRCPACGNLVYPTISPAVIVGRHPWRTACSSPSTPPGDHPELRSHRRLR